MRQEELFKALISELKKLNSNTERLANATERIASSLERPEEQLCCFDTEQGPQSPNPPPTAPVESQQQLSATVSSTNFACLTFGGESSATKTVKSKLSKQAAKKEEERFQHAKAKGCMLNPVVCA